MDELDRVLVEAWERVGQRLLDRPWELVKRMERVRRAELRRPVRAWVVAVRASDTRIGDGGCSADRPWGDFGCETSEHRADKGRRHRVTLTGARLGQLVKPVRVVPGAEALSVRQMAARLGRDTRTVNDWLKKGVLVGKKENNPDRRGGPGWALATVGAIDPQADGGGRAGGGSESLWGTAWQHHWERVPGDLYQRLVRVPRLRSARMRRGVAGVGLGGADDWPTATWEHGGVKMTVYLPRVGSGAEEQVGSGEAGGSGKPAESGEAGEGSVGSGEPVGTGEPGGLKPPPPLAKWVGWDWECPGRWVIGASGTWERVVCGRVCKKLWLALPAWHLGKYMAGRGSAGEQAWARLPGVGAWGGEGSAMGSGGVLGVGVAGGAGVEGLAGGLKPPPPGGYEMASLGDGRPRGLNPPPPGLACARCLGLRHDGAGDEAWNRFVTVMSGGLLYGREVERVVAVAGA